MNCPECAVKMNFFLRLKKPDYFECPECGERFEVNTNVLNQKEG